MSAAATQRGVLPTAPAATPTEARDLAGELRRRINGEVRFEDGDRALYATDASNYRQVPIGVVIPAHIDDVIQTIAVCRQFGAPVLPRGGGTSLAGQCCNAAVVIDMSKYLRGILELNPDEKWARVQPGVIPDDLNHLAERQHLTFAPVPATHGWCTIGGMVGNNSCGIHSVMGGCTVSNVEELEVLTYDGLRMRVGRTSDDELQRIIGQGGRRGEIYARLKSLRDRYADLIRRRYPDIPRRVSGFNLNELLPENGFHVARALVGSEGTCVTILEARLRLIYSPPRRALLVLGYPDVYQAGDHVTEIMAQGPTALEGLDHRLIRYNERKGMNPVPRRLLPEGGGWLLVQFGGESQQEANDRARQLMEMLRQQRNAPTMRVFDDPEQQASLWELRESGLGATAHVPSEPDTWPGWEDSAVPPEKLGDYLRDLRRLYDRYSYDAALYGHFGQGCVHTRIPFDLLTAEGIARYRAFVDEAADTVVRYGGSLSGEHGDGQSRAELLPRMFGPELVEAFREFKSIWDPDWKMNPGKVVEAYPITENLRLGSDYGPPQPRTHFQFPEDRGSFARAALRCVGVGECRKLDSGTMCPSYMVLLEEKHTTRGRAHALFEMLQGAPVDRGWRDEYVKQSLDLCLACKGCKGECPVNVDLATYKAEFNSHYYAGRLRPMSAYAYGLIMYWARIAERVPGLVNFVAHAPLLSDVGKALIGMAQQRRAPHFARETFKRWFRRRGPRNLGQPRVVLWPDTFNNYFHPSTAQAAVEVLEAAGFQVLVPEQAFCCGRPVYDFGMLDVGKRLLRQAMDTLRPYLRAGVPIVVLEPSCASTFRDELVGLFPHDQDARRLAAQTLLLSEFLEQKAPDFQPPRLERKAVVHGHCHHKSILGMDAEGAVLSRMGLDFTVLDSGCCGLAGSFGYEKGAHYAVSMGAGERVLLPATREAPKDALIVADGFSCREQIAHATDRQALHLAQALQMALREGPAGPPGDYPETRYCQPTAATLRQTSPKALAAAGIGAAALGVGILAWKRRRRSGE